MTFRFKATEDQIKQIAVNAINASKPVGMGFLHYKPEDIDVKELPSVGKGCFIDYYDGRMVKLNIHKHPEGEWETRSGEADPEYQSWAYKYPTFESLVACVVPL